MPSKVLLKFWNKVVELNFKKRMYVEQLDTLGRKFFNFVSFAAHFGGIKQLSIKSEARFY